MPSALPPCRTANFSPRSIATSAVALQTASQSKPGALAAIELLLTTASGDRAGQFAMTQADAREIVLAGGPGKARRRFRGNTLAQQVPPDARCAVLARQPARAFLGEPLFGKLFLVF